MHGSPSRSCTSRILPACPALRRLMYCRYHCNLNILLGKMRGSGGVIKWADVGALKAELEVQVRGGAGSSRRAGAMATCWHGHVLAGAEYLWYACDVVSTPR